MGKYLKQAGVALKQLWAKEPARVVSVATAVVVFVAAKVGIMVPAQSVGSAVAFVLPLLLGGELIRSRVSPAVKPTTEPKA